MEEFILAFDTSNKVMEAEMKLKGALPLRMIPLPPAIQRGCGLCLKVEGHLEEIKKSCEDHGIQGEIYYVDRSVKTTYTKVKL